MRTYDVTYTMRRHKGRYYVIWYDAATKRRRWTSLRTVGKRQAQRRREDLVADFHDGRFDPWADTARFGVMTAREAAEAFLEAKKRTCREKTILDYSKFVLMCADTWPAGLDVALLTPEHMRLIILQPPAPASKRSYHRRMSVWMNWLVDQGYIDTSPLKGCEKPQAGRKIPEYLDKGEAERVLSAAREMGTWQAYGIAIALHTGMRRGELCDLRWSQVDFSAGRVYVDSRAGFVPKSGAHVIPLFPEAEKAMKALRSQHYQLFESRPAPDAYAIHEAGQPILPDRFTKDFKKAARAAGLSERYSLHSCRHTFASWCVQSGTAIYTVSKWLGHANVKTTEIYAHLSPEYSAEVPRMFQRESTAIKDRQL